MSVASQIERIRTQKSKIRNKLVAMGLATSTDNLDKLATAVDGITNHANIQAEVLEGSTYTIPKGYHNGSGVVIAKTDVQGDYARYVLQAKTGIIPNETQQTITSDEGNYGLSSVTVEPIPSNYKDVSNVTVERADVLANKIIIDKNGAETTGTMPNNGAINVKVDPATHTTASIKIPKGYHDGNGKVYWEYTEDKIITPNENPQNIYAEPGTVGMQRVLVEPIPPNYLDTTDRDNHKDRDDVSVDGPDVTIAPGYYPQKVEAHVVVRDLNTPTITVSETGLITASIVQPDGYVYEWEIDKTMQLPIMAGGTITPTKDRQIAIEEGHFATGDINVEPIPDTFLDTLDGANHKGDSNLTVSDATVTVQAGYYPNGASKSVSYRGYVDTAADPLVVGADGVMNNLQINAYVTEMDIILDPALEEALAEI